MIEVKFTGEKPEEIVSQLNGYLDAFSGAVQPQSQLPTDPPPKRTESAPETGEDKFAGVDANGVPWDARIHSEAKEPKKADGTWKRRKGVDDAEYQRVHNELLAAQSDTVTEQPDNTPAPAPQPDSTPAPAPQPDSTPAPAPTNDAPVPQPDSTPAPAPESDDPEVLRKYAQGKLSKVITILNEQLGAGKGVPILQAALGNYGATSGLPSVSADKLPSLNDTFDRMIADPANAEAIANGLA